MTDCISYETLERIHVRKPIERVGFIAEMCRGKRVLDIGCLDETALVKKDTVHWLHGRIATVAQQVVGIDNSALIPAGGLQTGENSKIFNGDGLDPQLPGMNDEDIDVIVAGEFIEHIECPLEFLKNIKKRFPGVVLVISTPNGLSFSNTILGIIGREGQHCDHLFNSTYKTLNTLCIKAGFKSWKIVPYRFYATEMILNSNGLKRVIVKIAQYFLRIVEMMFPLLSFGYVVTVRI